MHPLSAVLNQKSETKGSCDKSLDLDDSNISRLHSGFRQPFSLQNYTLHYPYAVHERVTANQCYVIVVIAPAIIIAFWTLVIDGLFSHAQPAADEPSGWRFGRYRLKHRLWELNCGILGLALSEGMAFVITGTFKNAIGKPRPDLIDRCQPKPGFADPLPFGLSNSTICSQQDMAILKDGFRSFPSGHSSSTFTGRPRIVLVIEDTTLTVT